MSNYPPEEFGPAPLRATVPRVRWHMVRNNSGEAIPPYACMEIESVELDTLGEIVYVVKKPTGNQQISLHLFNGATTIPSESSSSKGRGTFDLPAQALADASGSYSLGKLIGPKASQWYLAAGNCGFQVLGADPAVTSSLSSSHKRVIVQRSPGSFTAKTGSGIAARSSDTPGDGGVTIYYKAAGGSLTSYSQDVTAYNSVDADVAADAYVQVKIDAFGTPWVDVENC